MKKNFIKHGNLAKVKSHSEQLNGKFCTNVITCNKTLPDGSVVNVLEDNAEFAREEVNNIRLS